MPPPAKPGRPCASSRFDAAFENTVTPPPACVRISSGPSSPTTAQRPVPKLPAGAELFEAFLAD